MSQPPKVYFRADGNSEIGLGHVIRSLALADMLKNDFACHFVIRMPLEILKNQILIACESIIELPNADNVNEEVDFLIENHLTGEEIVVLDGYHFGESYQKDIRKKGSKLVCIDDIQHTHFSADAVINHAPGLDLQVFSKETYTNLFLGTEYALLRPAFLKAAVVKRIPTEIETIFICFGGADFNNLSLKVLQLFSAFKNRKYNINMVLGGANKFKQQIKNFAETIKESTINLYENLSAEQMVEVMQKSDVAIVPASSIMYEVLAVKMPIIGGYYVDNQVNIYHGFNEKELIIGVGDLNEFVDYESVLDKLSVNKIKVFLNKQEKVGITQAKKNHISLFKFLL